MADRLLLGVGSVVELVHPCGVHVGELGDVDVLPVLLAVLRVVAELCVVAWLEREVRVGLEAVALVVLDDDVVSRLEVGDGVGEQFLHAQVVLELTIVVGGLVLVLPGGVVVEEPLVGFVQEHVLVAAGCAVLRGEAVVVGVPGEVVVGGLGCESEGSQAVVVGIGVGLVVRVVPGGVRVLDLLTRGLALRIGAEAELVRATGDAHVVVVGQVVELVHVGEVVGDDLAGQDGRDVGQGFRVGVAGGAVGEAGPHVGVEVSLVVLVAVLESLWPVVGGGVGVDGGFAVASGRYAEVGVAG